MRLTVIVNPAAGRSKPALETLFRPYSTSVEIVTTTRPGDAEQWARVASASGADVVAVCGGDGTVIEAARGLSGTTTPLAILPGGTANLLAHDLHIPRRLTAAAALIFDPRARLRPIDMGVSNGQYFFHLGIGLEGEMVRRSGRKVKTAAGLLAYYVAALRTLPLYPPAHYHLTLDGTPHDISGINCTITSYGSIGLAGLSLSRRIDPGDGLLDVIIIRRADLKRLLLAGTSAVLTRDLQRAVWHEQAREIKLEIDPPQAITRDGELPDPPEASDLSVRTVPGAVQVITPGP